MVVVVLKTDLTRRHAIDVLATVDIGLGDLVENGGRRLTALVEHVDESIGVTRVLGYEDRDVLADVGHSHAVQVDAQAYREVRVYDIVQLRKF